MIYKIINPKVSKCSWNKSGVYLEVEIEAPSKSIHHGRWSMSREEAVALRNALNELIDAGTVEHTNRIKAEATEVLTDLWTAVDNGLAPDSPLYLETMEEVKSIIEPLENKEGFLEWAREQYLEFQEESKVITLESRTAYLAARLKDKKKKKP